MTHLTSLGGVSVHVVITLSPLVLRGFWRNRDKQIVLHPLSPFCNPKRGQSLTGGIVDVLHCKVFDMAAPKPRDWWLPVSPGEPSGRIVPTQPWLPKGGPTAAGHLAVPGVRCSVPAQCLLSCQLPGVGKY